MQRFVGVKGRRRKWRGSEHDFGNIDQKMANALAGIVLTIVSSRICSSMFPHQTANQCVAIFIGAALQTIGIAAENQTGELND